jgi:hypothetical protein
LKLLTPTTGVKASSNTIGLRISKLSLVYLGSTSGTSFQGAIGLDVANISYSLVDDVGIYGFFTGVSMTASPEGPYLVGFEDVYINGAGPGLGCTGYFASYNYLIGSANGCWIERGQVKSCDYGIWWNGVELCTVHNLALEGNYKNHVRMDGDCGSNRVHVGYWEIDPPSTGMFLINGSVDFASNVFEYVSRNDGSVVIDPASVLANNVVVASEGQSVTSGSSIELTAPTIELTAPTIDVVGTSNVSIESDSQTLLIVGGYVTTFTDSYISTTLGSFEFAGSGSAEIFIAPSVSDVAPGNLEFLAGRPFASATTYKSPGNIVYTIPSPVSGGTAGKHSFVVSNSETVSIGSTGLVVNAFFWLKTPVLALAGGTAPTVTTHSGDAGAVTLATGSCDQAGTLTIIASSNAAANGSIQLTFGTAFSQNGVSVFLDLVDYSGTWQVSASKKITAQSNSGFTLEWINASTSLSAGSMYQINYLVMPR